MTSSLEAIASLHVHIVCWILCLMSFGVLCDVVMFDAVMPVADGCWMYRILDRIIAILHDHHL